MEAGALRNRITIQEKSVVRDTYGAETITWVEHCQAWASMEPLSGAGVPGEPADPGGGDGEGDGALPGGDRAGDESAYLARGR